jgi:hypothetical protein
MLTHTRDELQAVFLMHLLSLGLERALGARTDSATANSIRVSQMIGFGAGAAERLQVALKMPSNADGAKRILELHPMFNPAAYVSAEEEGDQLVFTRSQAHDDEAWVSLLGRDEVRPLQAIVQAVDPTLDVDVVEVSDGWAVAVTEGHDAAPQTKEGAVTKMGDIATWQFEKRMSLPLTVV